MDEIYRKCPRCGLDVYRPKWEQHDRDCASVALRFGSAREMARRFLAEPEMRLSDLMRELPGVGRRPLRLLLETGGVTADMLRTRQEAGHDCASPRCRRCTILLDARGVRRGRNDAGLCGWCDGTAPDLRLEPGDGLPVMTATATARPRSALQSGRVR